MKLRQKLTPWTIWLGTLIFFLIAGLAAGIAIFWKGLWLTNLNDLVPWGLWITIDLSSIALSAGAFSLCAAVYLIGLKQYQPVVRTACYIGVTGYTMAVLTLLLDIGRPDRFWHALVYWNKHSLLWEVTMCVTLYLTVLLFEVAPTLARMPWLQKRFPKLSEKMYCSHDYAPILAIVGLGLSILHQSSLGAVYGVLKARPIWYKPAMPVLFMISAIAGGIAFTVFVSMISSRISDKAKVDDTLLERLSYFVGWVLAGYLYFRFWDALSMTYTYAPGRTEALQLLTSGMLSFNFWTGEILLGILIPMILLLYRRTREHQLWRMVALAMVVGGLVAFRWDTNLSGMLVVLSYLPGNPTVQYTMYRPSLIEWLSGLGVIAYGFLVISLGIRYLGIINHSEGELHPPLPQQVEIPA